MFVEEWKDFISSDKTMISYLLKKEIYSKVPNKRTYTIPGL